MSENRIYSIGHGNKKIEIFISELTSFEIEYLLDIRTKPFSKYNPQFNQSQLATELKKFGITYVFVGDALGGLPEDKSCYNQEGKVDYEILRDKDFFKEGIRRLIKAHERNVRLVIMCSESKPEECHRSKLIGQELLKNNITIKHIVSSTVVKSQQEVINELTKGKGSIDIFGNEMNYTSRKSY